jgi:hypothetical protein
MGSNRIRARGLVLLCALGVLFYALSPLTFAQTTDTRYFEETEHNVSGEFLRFYDAYGGRAIFGYPLTRVLVENGRDVQYFQRARMELHTDKPQGQRVQLGDLGVELDYTQPPVSLAQIPLPGHPDKRFFPSTGHTVAFAFLDFYDNNEGPVVLGDPISEWVIELNGRIVQYFERGKLEWYPENPAGLRVQPGMLGTIYVEQFVDPIYTEREPNYSRRVPPALTPTPEEAAPLPTAVTGLRMRVTVKHPIIGLNGTQTIYAYVLDQDGQGVPGVIPEIEVAYRGGTVDRLTGGITDDNGHSHVDLQVDEPAPGYVVLINLVARYEGLEARAHTAFLPWW